MVHKVQNKREKKKSKNSNYRALVRVYLRQVILKISKSHVIMATPPFHKF